MVGVRTSGDEHRLGRSSEDETERPNRRMKSDLPFKTTSGLQPVMEETTAIEKDSDWSEAVRVEGYKDQLKKLSTRPLQDAETDRIPENIHAEDAAEGSHSFSGIPLESGAQDPLDLNAGVLNGIDCMQYRGGDTVTVGTDAMVTNGLTSSPSEDFPFGAGPPLNDFPDGELSGQYREALLAQTASSLVQAAMKAALDQLSAELEAAESQSPLTPSVT
ncbi:hypothetical protein AAFF_G00240730 [Aldrovandia affinis]|uniref:Uncharacterized protein n=1 Tax=Aldrovandia affinis TaxID=143900 RepID=A0AAD7SUJ5_9TELE|nr:hypothetical protein AAFF_G00240730 [Aldrovandia affinis]